MISKSNNSSPKKSAKTTRLNKFIANSGICSRREADMFIAMGMVKINGKIVVEMGYQVQPGDDVRYDGRRIISDKPAYVLLNKPKGFGTVINDPKGRKTVTSLVQKACKEMLFPVDKLDRETTGLLLMTNDSDLMKKLNHPRYQSKKMYHVELNKSVSSIHLNKLMGGIDLEDGKTKVSNAEHVDGGSSKEIGIELSSGKTKVIKRLFEAMGFTVVKLDRVRYAGLTKKDLPRGMYRHLTKNEISFLKMTK